MKTRALEALRKILSDRQITSLILIIMLFSIAYIIFVIVNLQSTELQVATQYTVFGETNFYRNKWYYLISFALFGLLVMSANVSIVVKLFFLELKNFAVAFAWLSIIIVAMAWFIANSVLSIAFLS